MSKKSYGIVLCRKNKLSGNYEFMLVRRRYTYAFCDFVCGRYTRVPPHARMQAIQKLLEKMTVNELIEVLSFDFDRMWHRIWLGFEQKEIFDQRKKLFYETFKNSDEIMRMIPKIKKSGEDLWGLPKGRPNNNEDGEVCASRELAEETGIHKRSYMITDSPLVVHTYTGDDGVFYRHEYYTALALPDLINAKSAARKLCGTKESFREVDDIKWMCMVRIKALDNAHHILPIVKQVLINVRMYNKGIAHPIYMPTRTEQSISHTDQSPMRIECCRLPNTSHTPLDTSVVSDHVRAGMKFILEAVKNKSRDECV